MRFLYTLMPRFQLLYLLDKDPALQKLARMVIASCYILARSLIVSHSQLDHYTILLCDGRDPPPHKRKVVVWLCETRRLKSCSVTHVYLFSVVSRANLVSDWCTKLAVFFSKPPAPKLEVCKCMYCM